MKNKTAMSTAGAITLAVAGGATAILMTLGGSADSQELAAEPELVVEYVDQDGNPVDAPSDVESDDNGTAPEATDGYEAEHEEDDYEDGDSEHEAYESYEESDEYGEEADGHDEYDHEEEEYEDHDNDGDTHEEEEADTEEEEDDDEDEGGEEDDDDDHV